MRGKPASAGRYCGNPQTTGRTHSPGMRPRGAAGAIGRLPIFPIAVQLRGAPIKKRPTRMAGRFASEGFPSAGSLPLERQTGNVGASIAG